MNWHKPTPDGWGNPHFLRCPVCAAMLLNDADASLHAAWHDRVEVKITAKPANSNAV